MVADAKPMRRSRTCHSLPVQRHVRIFHKLLSNASLDIRGLAASRRSLVFHFSTVDSLALSTNRHLTIYKSQRLQRKIKIPRDVVYWRSWLFS
jgi:hypothetical protein